MSSVVYCCLLFRSFFPRNGWLKTVANVRNKFVQDKKLAGSIIGFGTLEESWEAVFWTDIQVVLDWIASSKKQTAYIANRLREKLATTEAKQWKHVPTLHNPADHGTSGFYSNPRPKRYAPF